MSATADQAGGRSGTVRRALPWVAILVGIALAGALSSRAAEDLPLDPRSTGPDGTRALVEVLGDLDVPVDLAPENLGDSTRALLLIDDLDDAERDTLSDWVADGGVLVVTDPRSPFAPEIAGSAAVGGFGVAPLAPACDLAAVRNVGEVLPASSAVVYDLPEDAVGCFPRDDGHWLVAQPLGAGAVIALGGPDVLVNARLDAADHPALLVGLLADTEGRVAVLRTRLPGEGDAGLVDLIGDNVRLFAGQLLIALLLLIAWRARRHGAPVEEPQPVAIPGSELVTALGNLLQEGGSREHAADLLRSDLRRTLIRRLGLPRGTPDPQLADAAATRAGVDPAAVLGALNGAVPTDDHELVALADAVERTRSQVLGSPSTARTAP